MFNYSKVFSGFSVDDLVKARAFYQNVLGLDVTGSEGVLRMRVSSGADVIIYGKKDHVPATFTILNFAVEDIEKGVEELTAAGVKFVLYNDGPLKTDEKGIFRGGGPLIAWFKDPAGNFISVLQES